MPVFTKCNTAFLLLMIGISAFAAPADRIARAIDGRTTTILKGHMHRLAVAANDRGLADSDFHMDHMVLTFKLSPSQQSELDELLRDQQNPSSPNFHEWLTPEEFGVRFGLSANDNSKVTAWLQGEGFTINESARGRNWIAFSGSASQVTRTFHTPVHRFDIKGISRFANTAEPAVPLELADVVEGVLGLNDFLPQSNINVLGPAPDPNYTTGTTHYLAPEDYATIYNLAGLYRAGYDGNGQNIVVVGASALSLDDVRAFRLRFGLPAIDPVLIPYGSELTNLNAEANLDVEWAGAVAPRATINYVYGSSPFTAITFAVNLNIAPVISVSWFTCENDISPQFYRSVMQQGNAQGITILSASGDGGAAGCFDQFTAGATHGPQNQFPGTLPEVTGVGGTMFVEGSGTYWGTINSNNLGSALSYIPEAAWNESALGTSVAGSGGGPSAIYPKPAWQTGPGVPNDNARDTPDIALTAAGHDAYFIVYNKVNYITYGTSASAPSMSGIIAILNQYQVSKGFQRRPGLGNINPQLYRLAQAAPTAFHDIVDGDNIVPCVQGSPGCLTGSFGNRAGPGYDMATGLGSVEAFNFVTKWNTAVGAAVVTLTASNLKPTLNDQVVLTAIVAAQGSSGTPTGVVEFSVSGTEVALGSAPLTANPLNVNGGASSASVTVAAWLLSSGGTNTYTVFAQYFGDAAFTSAGSNLQISVSAPKGISAIVPSLSASTAFPVVDTQGRLWTERITLRDAAGVPSQLTGFTIDGVAQTLAQYFPSASIPASGSIISYPITFRNLTGFPVTKTFAFAGTDAGGQAWTRQISAVLLGSTTSSGGFNPTLVPLTMVQNTAASPTCQWSQQLFVDETNGGRTSLFSLMQGALDLSPQIPTIFGTGRLTAFGSLGGTLCWSGYSPGDSDFVSVLLSNGLTASLQVSFAGPPASPVQITATPTSVNLASGPNQTASGTLTVALSDKTQGWSATVLPANRTTAWLSLSQRSGTGTAQVTLKASGAGFEPGAYRALVVLQSPSSAATVTVPIMFVLGASGSVTITSAGNAASFGKTGAPGMLFSVFGTGFASTSVTNTGVALPFAAGNVSAQVNGQAAPISYVSPTQINFLIPYEAGAGPAVLAVNNNGQVAGYQFQIAPAAPAIFADTAGFLSGNATAKVGGTVTMYLTGDGEITPSLLSGSSTASTTTPQNLPKSRLPFAVTIGGMPVFLQSYGIPSGMFGVTRVSMTVPGGVATGVQPVVVTVGGVASAPVNITIQ